MAERFRYHRPGPRLEFYTHPYDYSEQHIADQPGEQPPRTRDLIPLGRIDALALEQDEPDIRGYAVNTPNGSTLGTVVGLLVDMANSIIPYAYVQTEDGRTVVVPTNQFMFFPNMQLVTLEGGKEALRHAPEAIMNKEDAVHADRYWHEYRRQNAA